jgi:hypothetical protein
MHSKENAASDSPRCVTVWLMTSNGNQVSVLDPTSTLANELRTRWPAFALVRPVVGLPGLEPGTSSLSGIFAGCVQAGRADMASSQGW